MLCYLHQFVLSKTDISISFSERFETTTLVIFYASRIKLGGVSPIRNAKYQSLSRASYPN